MLVRLSVELKEIRVTFNKNILKLDADRIALQPMYRKQLDNCKCVGLG